jgi:DNA-directed RNA polymerase specialized sigma subunit
MKTSEDGIFVNANKAKMAGLPYSQRGVLECIYGAGDGYCYGQKQVASIFDMTEADVERLRASGIAALRETVK